MELDEMMNTWEEMSRKIDKQEHMTKALIDQMTQQKYHSKLNKIWYSEYVGTMVCYIGAAYLIMHFTRLEDILMQGFAIVAILLLFIIPVISLRSVKAIRAINIHANTYVDTINTFVRQKRNFIKLQKVNVSLALFLMLTVIPAVSAMRGKNLNDIPNFWTIIFPIGILFFSGFAYWVLRSYNKTLNETEKMLSDIRN